MKQNAQIIYQHSRDLHALENISKDTSCWFASDMLHCDRSCLDHEHNNIHLTLSVFLRNLTSN